MYTGVRAQPFAGGNSEAGPQARLRSARRNTNQEGEQNDEFHFNAGVNFDSCGGISVASDYSPRETQSCEKLAANEDDDGLGAWSAAFV
jgi:hypothetical protein